MQLETTTNTIPDDSISLRDYFAAIAMQGILAGKIATPGSIPTTAYEFADAMLEERSK